MDNVIRIIWTTTTSTFLIAAPACAEEVDTDNRSLVPSLQELESAILCLDRADGEEAQQACYVSSGLPLELSRDQKSIEYYQQSPLRLWAFMDTDSNQDITSADYKNALTFAKCVEDEVFSNPGFASGDANQLRQARFDADYSCQGLTLSAAEARELEIGDPKFVTVALDKMLAGAAIMYALEVNDWVPDEMRPCVHSIDQVDPLPAHCKRGQRLLKIPPPAPPGASK